LRTDVTKKLSQIRPMSKEEQEQMVAQLRQQQAQLAQQDNELKVLISAYANAISQSVKEECEEKKKKKRKRLNNA